MAQETIEEVAEKYAMYKYDNYNLHPDDHFLAGAKWQADRMIEFMEAYANDVMGGCALNAKEWYEQFKK